MPEYFRFETPWNPVGEIGMDGNFFGRIAGAGETFTQNESAPPKTFFLSITRFWSRKLCNTKNYTSDEQELEMLFAWEKVKDLTYGSILFA